MVARGGIEPPTRGFSVRLVSLYIFTNQSLAALATPLSRLFKAQFGHTQFVLDTIWARSKSTQHFPESHSGGIDQNSTR